MINTKICPNCQEANRPNAEFCLKCNTSLTVVAVETRHTGELPTGAPLRQVAKEQRVIPHIICQRYQVVEQRKIENGTLYTTEDLCRCATCGAELLAMEDKFCANCGVELTTHLQVELLALAETVSVPVDSTVCLEDKGIIYLVKSSEEPSAPELPTSNGYGVRWQIGYQSDVGQVREVDEDSLLALSVTGMLNGVSQQALGCFVIADGMGGAKGGDVASRMVVRQIGRAILTTLADRALQGAVITKEEMEHTLSTAIHTANQLVCDLQEETQTNMGSTVTAALLLDTQAVIANVGDSRTYLWRNGELTKLTQDHSLVARLVEAGELDEEALYSDDRRSIIYRSVGDPDGVEVDLFSAELAPHDRLILCCDGVWEPLRNEGMAEVLLSTADSQQACEMMVDRANLAGGEDNISVIVVTIEAL